MRRWNGSPAYKEQDLLQSTAEQTLNDYLELGSFVPPQPRDRSALEVSPQTAKDAVPDIRHTLAHLEGVYAVGRGLLGSYDDALKL